MRASGRIAGFGTRAAWATGRIAGFGIPERFFRPKIGKLGRFGTRFLPRSAIWSPTPEESPGHESRVSASRVPNLRSRHKAGIKPRMLAEKDTKLLDIVAPFPLGGTKRGVFAKATSTNSTAESRSADSSTENYKRARQHETLRQRKKRAPQPEGAFCQSTSRFAALGRLWLRVRAPLTFFAKEKPLFRALCFRQKNRRPVARGVKTPPNLRSPGKMTPRAAGYVLRTEG